MQGTFVRRDSITIHNENIEQIYDSIIQWLKKRGFKIISNNKPSQIYAEQRISGESIDIDHWHKNILINLDIQKQDVNITITLHSPYIMDNNQNKEAKLLWGEYIEKLYIFLGIELDKKILNQIHSSEYYGYKHNKNNYSKTFIYLLMIFFNLYFYNNLQNKTYLIFIIVFDIIIFYLINIMYGYKMDKMY